MEGGKLTTKELKKKFGKIVGSRAEVWHGTAYKTSGGLTKDKLMKNKHGRIISKARYEQGKKNMEYLKKSGHLAKKGKFGSAKRKQKGSKHSSRGGSSKRSSRRGSSKRSSRRKSSKRSSRRKSSKRSSRRKLSKRSSRRGSSKRSSRRGSSKRSSRREMRGGIARGKLGYLL